MIESTYDISIFLLKLGDKIGDNLNSSGNKRNTILVKI